MTSRHRLILLMTLIIFISITISQFAPNRDIVHTSAPIAQATQHACPEDAVLVWDGRTDDHTLCLTLDDWANAESIAQLHLMMEERGARRP